MKRLLKIAGLSAVGATAIFAWPLSVPVAEGAPYQELPKLQYSEHPNRHAISQVPKRIGIIGGGASGLITAKVLKQQGYAVEILEKREHYGGVWYRNYEGAGLQAPYPMYDMPDYYFPQGTTFLPKQEEVLKYFDRYVDQFNLNESLRLNSEVQNIRQLPDETWKVTLANGSQLTYDFLVLCNGVFHSPTIPNFPGFDSFTGRILHSSQLTNAKEVCAGKKVVVVGGGKSALDILDVASEYAQSTTGVMREIHHAVPIDFQLFGLNPLQLMFNRAANLFSLPDYCENQLLYKLLSPIGNLYWLFMGKMVSANLPDHAKPTVSFREDRLRPPSISVPDYTAKLNDRRINILPGEIERILPKGLALKSGQTVDADVLVFATGFKRNFFDMPQEEGEQWRYRGVLLPGVRNYAVIGNIEAKWMMLMINLQAVWLAEVLRGKVQLPPVTDMNKDIEQRKAYMKKHIKSSTISFLMKYDVAADQLVGDMGLQVRRESSWFAYWFGMPHPSLYRTIITHRV